MFKVGQKVVCVDASVRINIHPLGGLKEGEIYTVEKDLGFAVYLKEVKAPVTGHYYSDRFRPLDETFATEVLEQIKEQIEQEQLVLI